MKPEAIAPPQRMNSSFKLNILIVKTIQDKSNKRMCTTITTGIKMWEIIFLGIIQTLINSDKPIISNSIVGILAGITIFFTITKTKTAKKGNFLSVTFLVKKYKIVYVNVIGKLNKT